MGMNAFRHKFGSNALCGEAALRNDGLHMRHLRHVFDDLNVGTNIQYNRPLAVLAFANRSGSTYLGQLLASLPGLYGFREDLNHNIVSRRAAKQGLARFDDYMNHVTGIGASPGATFGLKASAEQIKILTLTGIDKAFQDLTVIRIRRRDRVAQAVSLWTAWQTRQWTSRQDPRPVQLRYDFSELRRYLQNILEAECAMDLALSVVPYPVLSVEYETLSAHPNRIVSALREGLKLAPTSVEAQSRIEVQTSPEKEEFTARFRADLAACWSLDGLTGGAS